MCQFKNLRKLVGALVVSAATVSGAMVNSATACDPACHFQWVTTFEYRTEKFVEWVVEFDDYGCKHRVPVVKYRTFKVPVRKYVKFCIG
jgi:hypothetical protein